MDVAPIHAGSPVDPRADLGRRGEDAALDVYAGRGYRLVARNWRVRSGEVDLVLGRRDGTLVFCEVKTRSGDAFGGGYEAVTREKQRKLRALAELFLATCRPPPEHVRFDVASVALRRRGPPSVEVFEDAF